MAFFDLFRRKQAPKPPGAAAPAPTVASPQPAEPGVSGASAPDDSADATAAVMEDAAGGDSFAGYQGPERRERARQLVREGTRALVIDDSPTIVALLKRILQQNRFEVLEAFDAESGIEIARRELPDLVFLDIVLPGMDGFNALRTLRREPLTRHIPVIMISGNAQATEQFYVQRIGADDFMKKPFSRAEVCARVDALLDGEGVPRHHARPVSRAEAAALAGAQAAGSE